MTQLLLQVEVKTLSRRNSSRRNRSSRTRHKLFQEGLGACPPRHPQENLGIQDLRDHMHLLGFQAKQISVAKIIHISSIQKPSRCYSTSSFFRSRADSFTHGANLKLRQANQCYNLGTCIQKALHTKQNLATIVNCIDSRVARQGLLTLPIWVRNSDIAKPRHTRAHARTTFACALVFNAVFIALIDTLWRHSQIISSNWSVGTPKYPSSIAHDFCIQLV